MKIEERIIEKIENIEHLFCDYWTLFDTQDMRKINIIEDKFQSLKITCEGIGKNESELEVIIKNHIESCSKSLDSHYKKEADIRFSEDRTKLLSFLEGQINAYERILIHLTEIKENSA